jgi:biopolymer transport protein ExbD/biopolymer transport protein TolR
MAKTDTARDMQDADKDDAIVVAITRDGAIYLGHTETRKDDLTNQIKDRLSNRLDKTVYVKSDARAKYGDVVAVVDEIRSAGVDQVGLLTEKNQGKSTTWGLSELRRRAVELCCAVDVIRLLNV